ncbi:MAG: type II secretion system F family protein [Candidatus Omnitrophica bacterium]|nr:type II secretion system F family protein [Candidatus Omnitrophota bacterium]
MGLFKYKAKKGPNKIIKAVINASSRQEAIDKISEMGYLPMFIEEVHDVGSATFSNKKLDRVKLKSKQVTVFTRQLAILLRSGVPILKGLLILAEQALHADFKAILNTINAQIKDGNSLSAALSAYPNIFSPLYVSLVRAGEDSGTLDVSLLRIAEYRQKQEQIFTNIKTALTYPILMALVGTGTIIFMLTFVMPRLLGIFTRLGQELPLPTKILISISNFLTQGWVWLVILGIGSSLLLYFKNSAPSRRRKIFISQLKLKFPVFGDVFLKAELARFSRTLELLLNSGVHVLNALQRSIPIIENEIMQDELKKAYKAIEQGESFGSTLEQSAVFPKFMVNLISVGEESGNLEDALKELAFTYEEETDEAVKVMTNLLEPIMILIMGIVVGFIIISMLLPVFQLNVMVN